MFENMKDLER